MNGRVSSGVARGLDLVDAMREISTQRATRARERSGRDAERHYRTAMAAHDKALRRHARAVRGWHRRMVVGSGLVVGGGAIALVDAGLGDGFGAGLVGVALAVIGGSTALGARARLGSAQEPTRPQVPQPSPPPLRHGARGATETMAYLHVRQRLLDIIPAVSGLHPEAGQELVRADIEAAPAMGALVARLEVLDRVEHEMPATNAATSAATAAEEIRTRLARGVVTYDRLIAAAAAMLAAPDLGRSADEVLAPALDALIAYTHGLGAMARAFDIDADGAAHATDPDPDVTGEQPPR